MENSFQEFVLDACLERAHAANSAEDASWRSTCTRRQQELGKRRGSAFCMSRAPGKEKSVLSFFFFALSGKKSAFSRFAGLSLALSLSIALSLRQALQRGFFLSRCLPPSLSLSATRCRALHAPLCQARDNSFAHLFPIEKEQRSHYRSIDSSPRGTLAVFISTFSSDNVRR